MLLTNGLWLFKWCLFGLIWWKYRCRLQLQISMEPAAKVSVECQTPAYQIQPRVTSDANLNKQLHVFLIQFSRGSRAQYQMVKCWFIMFPVPQPWIPIRLVTLQNKLRLYEGSSSNTHLQFQLKTSEADCKTWLSPFIPFGQHMWRENESPFAWFNPWRKTMSGTISSDATRKGLDT